VVDAETLRKAQAKPEEYQNLIVRVAGYSDYFVDLGQDLQNEIIARTEQKAFYGAVRRVLYIKLCGATTCAQMPQIPLKSFSRMRYHIGCRRAYLLPALIVIKL